MHRELRDDAAAEHDGGHHQDTHDERDDHIDLPRPRPHATEQIGAEQRAVRERRDAQGELHDRRVLILET
jgi:hypothetical protein